MLSLTKRTLKILSLCRGLRKYLVVKFPAWNIQSCNLHKSIKNARPWNSRVSGKHCQTPLSQQRFFRVKKLRLDFLKWSCWYDEIGHLSQPSKKKVTLCLPIMQCLPQALSNKRSSPADLQSKACDKPVLHKLRCPMPIKQNKCLCFVRQVITAIALYIVKYQLR